MSHFTVLVTKTDEESIDSQLERFYEQGEDGDYFMEKEIEVKAEDMKSEAEKITAEATKEGKDWAKEYEKLCKEGEYTEVCTQYYGGAVDDEGNLYYLSNPDAKWDWYVVGGRWSGYFTKKAGAEGEIGQPGVLSPPVTDETLADVIKVKDIDWEAMEKSQRKERADLYDEYHGEGKKPFIWDTKELDSMSREEYINRPISHATFAVLHEDEWYERGSMGWWAVVYGEKDKAVWDAEWKKLIEGLDPEAEVTIVDCHI